MPRARLAQTAITRAVDGIFRSTPRNPAVVAKAIFASFGLCGEAAFPPLAPLTDPEKQLILAQLPSLGIFAP